MIEGEHCLDIIRVKDSSWCFLTDCLLVLMLPLFAYKIIFSTNKKSFLIQVELYEYYLGPN